MTRDVTYYAIVTDRTSVERPAGIFRRTRSEEGLSEEAFTRDLAWEQSPLLASWRRGDLNNDFVEISEEDANAFIERLTARVKGESVD